MLRYVFLGVLSALWLFSAAWAGVGQEHATLRRTLVDIGANPMNMTHYQSPDGGSLNLEMVGRLVVRVEGQSTLDKDGLTFVPLLIKNLTDFWVNPEVLGAYLQNDVHELVGQGMQTFYNTGFVIGLELLNAEKPFQIRYYVEREHLEPSRLPTSRHTLGPDNARFVISEFSDLQCPACRRFHLEGLPIIKQLMAERGDIRFEQHHLPLMRIHPHALKAAEMAECAGDAYGEEAFWHIQDTLFTRQPRWAFQRKADTFFNELALELNYPLILPCLEARTFEAQIRTDFFIAVNDLGLNSTPTVFVNGFKVSNPNQRHSYETLLTLSEVLETNQ